MKKKNNMFIFVILIFFLDQIYCQGFDQSTRLKNTRYHKKNGEEWTTMLHKAGSEVSDFEIGNMEDDLIKGGLPGQPSGVTFKQFSGYVSLDTSKRRNLFYYFVEAVDEPSSKPLVLWLNGGPGCSSLGLGAMIELGPFGVEPDGKTLYRRRHSWNQVANTLFLESPAGVGFSYSNNTHDYNTTGDKSTAQDSHTFLINWFKRFPQYKSKDLFISGESYAGFYIPELADTIIKGNKHSGSSLINLKGIMVGNGIMNDPTDQKGRFNYYWSHAMISDETYLELKQNCKNMYSDECKDRELKIGSEVGHINFFNIYGSTCTSYTKSRRNIIRLAQGFDPCEEDYVYTYLNSPQVQKALHANITNLPYVWDFCSGLLDSWNDSPSTMFPIYKRLFASGLRILLYSGDVDAVVPVTSTRYSINALNLSVIKPWHPWYDATEEVAGHRVVYEGLSFSTIRGAGHEVPRYQSRRALALLDDFLAGKLHT